MQINVIVEMNLHFSKDAKVSIRREREETMVRNTYKDR